MSQYWSGYHGTALVLKEHEFLEFLNNYTAQNHTLYTPEDMLEDINEVTFFAPGSSGLEFQFIGISPDTCDGMVLAPFYQPYSDAESVMLLDLRGETLYVLFSEKNMSSASVFRGKEYRYESYDELLSEFKAKLEEYLHGGFDWNSHIGDFRYAAFA